MDIFKRNYQDVAIKENTQFLCSLAIRVSEAYPSTLVIEKEHASTFICPPAELNSPQTTTFSTECHYSFYHPTHNMETGLLRHQPSAKWRAVFWVCLSNRVKTLREGE